MNNHESILNYETLLDLLKNDPSIREAIKNIISLNVDLNNNEKQQVLKKELEESQQMIEKFKELLGISKSDNGALQADINQLKTRLDDSKKENVRLTEIKNINESKIKDYQKLFEDQIKVYERFDHLGDTTKKSLSGIFKDTSMTGFIACGIQEKNIGNLWEYIKNEVMENKNNDLLSLKEIFTFLFSRYAIAYPLYELQPIEIDEEFDTQRHIKHSSSQNVSGAIQAISLQGWINKKTGKVVKQSIVII